MISQYSQPLIGRYRLKIVKRMRIILGLLYLQCFRDGEWVVIDIASMWSAFIEMKEKK
jgi:hypothetical protein